MRITGIILVLFLLFQLPVQGQTYLVLKKRNKILTHFKEGDNIRIKLSNETGYYNDMILRFSQDKIHFRFNEIPLSEIEQIHVASTNSGKGIKIFSELTTTAGVLFFGLDMANQILFEGEIEPTKPTLLITGGLIGSGLLAKLFLKKKYNVKNYRYHLEITNFIPY